MGPGEGDTVRLAPPDASREALRVQRAAVLDAVATKVPAALWVAGAALSAYSSEVFTLAFSDPRVLA